MKSSETFKHPLKKEEITDENYRQVADHLFRCQLQYNLSYQVGILEHGWSDDDTDYARTMFRASEELMDLAYDHNRDDLIHFLFTLRTDYEQVGKQTFMEPLHLLDSAGGLCTELNLYLEPLYAEEERREAWAKSL